LNRFFVTKYSFDFLGNVTEVKNSSYSGSTSFEEFYHHYEYDNDTRLSKALTSVDGVHKVERATYEYYLHGPLKRVVLGSKLQGIDFVYNINGWLTHINHPDNNYDPGMDGDASGPHADVRRDVFGIVLDYYTSSLNNLYASTAPIPSEYHNIFHGLPAQDQPRFTSHQPLPKFNGLIESGNGFNGNTLKKYSAENPRYQGMISDLSGTNGN